MKMKFVNSMTALLFTVLIGTHVAANAANSVPLVEPGPISIPADKVFTLEEIKKAVTAGAIRHQWRVESQTPGSVRIILDGRNDKAVLVMDVVFDEKKYNIKYVRSENLNYVKGNGSTVQLNPNSNTVSRFAGEVTQTTIHSSYSRWMKILTREIDTELNVAKLK
jgi:hypothetical protein